MLSLRASSLIREEGAMVRGIRRPYRHFPSLDHSPHEIDELFDCIRRGLDRLWN
jgi:hypothetical protein